MRKMKQEITARSVLEETLRRHEILLRGYSRNGNSLEPAEGHEKSFEAERDKCRIIRELMQALVSEPVKAGMAKWQMEAMDGKKQVGLFGEDWTESIGYEQEMRL